MGYRGLRIDERQLEARSLERQGQLGDVPEQAQFAVTSGLNRTPFRA